jgi:hypothetical protein
MATNDSADRLSILPATIELHESGAFADGGTVYLYSELPDATRIYFYLPPINSCLWADRKPQFYLQIYYADGRDSESHDVAIRSELESQLIKLLKNCEINYRHTQRFLRAMADRGDQIEEIGEEERIQINRDLASTRDNFVAIIESDEYVRRNVEQNSE